MYQVSPTCEFCRAGLDKEQSRWDWFISHLFRLKKFLGMGLKMDIEKLSPEEILGLEILDQVETEIKLRKK